jgi:hypothetical protein
MGFPYRDIARFGMVFPYRNSRFFHTGFLFFLSPLPVSFAVLDGALILGIASVARDLFGFLDGLDSAPVVGRRPAVAVSMLRERRSKKTGRAILGITAATTLNSDEAERFGFAYCRGDRAAIHAIGDEVLSRDRQPVVIVTAVMREFDFDSRYHHVSRT